MRQRLRGHRLCDLRFAFWFFFRGRLSCEGIENGRNLRQLEEHVNLALVSSTFDETVHHVHHPCGAFSTWGALSTGFVFVELRVRGWTMCHFLRENDE